MPAYVRCTTNQIKPKKRSTIPKWQQQQKKNCKASKLCKWEVFQRNVTNLPALMNKVIDKPNTWDAKKTTFKSKKSGQWKSTWIASFEK